MSHLSVAAAISTRFKTLVEIPSGLPTQYDNADFDHPDDSPWLQCNILWNEESGDQGMVTGQQTMGSVGQRTFRLSGLLSIQVYAPIGHGDRESLIVVDLITQSFRGITADNITYRTAAIPTGPKRTQNGKWWQTDVVCSWYTDELG